MADISPTPTSKQGKSRAPRKPRDPNAPPKPAMFVVKFRTDTGYELADDKATFTTFNAAVSFASHLVNEARKRGASFAKVRITPLYKNKETKRFDNPLNEILFERGYGYEAHP